jgi:hypothetical protein
MLFARYRLMNSSPSNTWELYSTDIDAGHAPLTGLNLNVTVVAPTLVQVGWYDGTTFTPQYTVSVNPPAIGQPTTGSFSFPNLINDGTYQLGVQVNNLDPSAAHDIYLDMSGTEAD